jgi:hypothetical protein
MASVPPIALSGIDEPEIDLIDQFGGLQGVPLALALHEVVGETAQIGHDERKELVLGLGTTFTPPVQKTSDVCSIRHGLPRFAGMVQQIGRENKEKN